MNVMNVTNELYCLIAKNSLLMFISITKFCKRSEQGELPSKQNETGLSECNERNESTIVKHSRQTLCERIHSLQKSHMYTKGMTEG